MEFTLRKIGGNALSILTSDVMNRATTFVLYALVARHLGAHEFGQLTLALTLFYICQVLAITGLKTFIIRQVARNREQTRQYFLNASALVAFSSLLSVALLLLFVRLMNYPADTSRVILLLALGLCPYAFSAVCEGIFQAWEQMHFIPWVNVPVNLAKIAFAVFLLSTGRGLYAIVLILLLSYFAIAGLEACVILRRFPSQQAHLDLQFSCATIKGAVTFLGIDGAVAIMSSLNILLLSKLATETDVGLFNAATQVLVPLLLVYQSIAQSIFPVMCRRVEPGFQYLKQIAEHAIELLLALALPAVVGLLFLGKWALLILYRNPVFLQANTALQVIAWILLAQALTSVLGQVLLATHREKIALRIVVVDTLINLVIGWPLIRWYGLCGAAFAMLITRIADCIQHYIPVARIFSGIPLTKIVWKPVLAAACMASGLTMLASRNGPLAGVTATLIYGAVLLVLFVQGPGGMRQLKARFFPTS